MLERSSIIVRLAFACAASFLRARASVSARRAWLRGPFLSRTKHTYSTVHVVAKSPPMLAISNLLQPRHPSIGALSLVSCCPNAVATRARSSWLAAGSARCCWRPSSHSIAAAIAKVLRRHPASRPCTCCKSSRAFLACAAALAPRMEPRFMRQRRAQAAKRGH